MGRGAVIPLPRWRKWSVCRQILVHALICQQKLRRSEVEPLITSMGKINRLLVRKIFNLTLRVGKFEM